jgi:hypothetical protein
LHLTHVGGWVGELQFYFPYIVGFAIVAVGIPYVAKIAIPTFMSLHWRGGFWPKLWALIIAVAVSLVVIAGTFTVQGDTIMERDRGAAVAVEQVQIAAATLQAQIGDVQHAMDERTQSPSAYVRTAASMSPEAYDRFVAARVGDPQYQRLVSYRAVSEEMVALNQQMSALRQQQAQSTAVASVQGEVVTERTGWIADTLGWLEGVRAILLSLVMDIVCLIMPWIALRLEQARNRQMSVEASGWADRAHRIEDLRHEPVRETEPLTPIKRRYTDADTGDEIEESFVRAHKRERKIKRGEKIKVQIQPDIPPDETGAVDGGHRTASVTIGGLMEAAPEQVEEAVTVDAPPATLTVEEGLPADDKHAAESEALPSHELSDDEVPLFEDEADETNTQTQDPEPVESVQENDAEPDQQREPETDPSRLIAAE